MRRNRRKDIFLDFTSLLDVTLLLLFFFVLTFHADVTNAEAKAEQRVNAAEMEAHQQIQSAKTAEAKAKESKIKYDELVQENKELNEKLKNDIQIVNRVTSQEANEIIIFNSGNNLKLILSEASSSKIPMTLKAVLNQKVMGECFVTEDEDSEEYKAEDITSEKLISWMTSGGIKKDSVIMCDFVYSSSNHRSSEAYDKINRILGTIQSEYGYDHFYYSPTNISIRSRKE